MIDKKIQTVLFFLVSIIITSCVPVSATNQTVSASTGEIEVGGGVLVELRCQYDVGLSAPDKIGPGEQTNLLLNLYSGSQTLRVYVPDPVNQWFSRDLDITSSGSITITPGLSVNLDISPVTFLEVSGPADLYTTELNWGQSFFTRDISLSCHNDAQNGYSITVNAVFAIDLSLGVNIELPLFSKNIASFELTRLELTPKIS